jgi:hypothetical protein
MALMKKKNDSPAVEEPEAGAEAPGATEVAADVADAEAGEAAAPELTPADGVEAPAEDIVEAGDAASLDTSDALLSLFGGEDDGSADRELIVQMAGEVEVVDLIDELRTVAAALRIVERRAS